MNRFTTRTPFWVRDPALWEAFIAALTDRGDTELPNAIDHAGTRVIVRPLLRDIRELDDELTEDQLEQLDDVAFAWAGDPAPAPAVTPPTTDRNPNLVARRLHNGQLPLDRVLEARENPALRGDPLVTWFERGIGTLRNTRTPILNALADAELIGTYNQQAFALGTWAPEAARAVARGHYDDIRERVIEPLTTSEYLTLRNVGLLADHLASTGVLDVHSTLVVGLVDGSDYALGRWYADIARQGRAGALSPVAVEAFRRIGIDPTRSRADRAWFRNLAAAQRFLERTGLDTVPFGHVEQFPDGSTIDLYGWVSRTRTAWRRGKLAADRAKAFEELGLTEVNPTPGVRRGRFEENLAALERYLREHDGTDPTRNAIGVRPNGDTFNLGLWLRHVRQRHLAGKLPESQAQRILDLGVRLEVYNHRDRAADALIALKQFVRREGHANVPFRHQEHLASGTDFALGTWLRSQRRRHGRGDLTANRKAELEALGVDLGPQRSYQEEWRLGLAALDSYFERTGHANPRVHECEQLPDGTIVPVGQWLATKRKQYRDGKLRTERVAALEARGVIWNPQHTRFMTGLRLLAKFKQEHGHVEIPFHCVVPGPDGEPFSLGAWLETRRKQLARGRLSAERASALHALGVSTANRLDARFERGLELLDAFVAEHGHGVVPEQYVATTADGLEVNLGHWVLNFRNQHAAGTLSPERATTLADHGFIFNVPEYRFRTGLAVLDGFIEREGTAAVPSSHEEVLADGSVFKLGQWVENKRRSARRGTLAPDHATALCDRGIYLDQTTGHERATRGR